MVYIEKKNKKTFDKTKEKNIMLLHYYLILLQMDLQKLESMTEEQLIDLICTAEMVHKDKLRKRLHAKVYWDVDNYESETHLQIARQVEQHNLSLISENA